LPELQTLLAKDSSLRIIYKEFPILGPQSQTAARAALAAGRQGKFAEFHQALLESNGVSEDEIKELSGRLRLDYAALQRDMNDPKIIAAIDRNIRLAASLNINGTPAYLIGSRVIPGAIDFDSLITIIKAERVKLSAKQ
jgi:protein-disulfide isomerase